MSLEGLGARGLVCLCVDVPVVMSSHSGRYPVGQRGFGLEYAAINVRSYRGSVVVSPGIGVGGGCPGF